MTNLSWLTNSQESPNASRRPPGLTLGPSAPQPATLGDLVRLLGPSLLSREVLTRGFPLGAAVSQVVKPCGARQAPLSALTEPSAGAAQACPPPPPPPPPPGPGPGPEDSPAGAIGPGSLMPEMMVGGDSRFQRRPASHLPDPRLSSQDGLGHFL